MVIDKDNKPVRDAHEASSAAEDLEKAPAAGKQRQGSPIEFRLDSSSGVPTFLQLVQQVEHALRLGYLKAGDQLPRIRDAVASLAVNPNTVLKAYRELEMKGLAEGRPGQGTFVKTTLRQVGLPELGTLRRSLHRWLSAAQAAGLNADGMTALFTGSLREFHESRGSSGDDSKSASVA